MFTDPFPNFTYNGVGQTLPRISTSGTKSVYRTADGVFVLTVSHQTVANGKVRSMCRVDRNVDLNADLVLETEAAYVVLERPTGFSETDTVNLLTALFGSLTASTNAGIKKLHAQES